MKVFELSKEFDATNKEMIDFLKERGFKVSSHSQTLTDEMIEVARKDFVKKEAEVKTEEEAPAPAPKRTARKTAPPKAIKKFAPEDMILCRSVVPWPIVKPGQNTVYRWPYFGYEDYVAFKDLQSWRQTPIVKEPMIMIEDPDICDQWKHDLGNLYQKYLGVSYPEEFFEKDDEEFRKTLESATLTFKELIKYTAMDMIRNQNYPSVAKIVIIDEVLGTGIKDFL